MRFSTDAPGALTPSGGSYVGEWSVSASNVGLSAGAVETWVSSALNDSLGWTPLGISFDQVGGGSGVEFRSVADLPGNAIGTCYYDVFPPRIDLKASWVGNKDLVNHEAAHAFFFASHSPEGSVSIMEPMEDPGEEGPSETDFQQVADWLGLPWPPGDPSDPIEPEVALAPGLYWHPLNLSGYKTRWSLAEASSVRLTVSVSDARFRGAEGGPTLAAVYSEDKDAPIADWLPLGASVGIDGMSIHDSGWQDIASGATGDVYLGATLDVPLPLDALTVGAADIRIK